MTDFEINFQRAFETKVFRRINTKANKENLYEIIKAKRTWITLY